MKIKAVNFKNIKTIYRKPGTYTVVLELNNERPDLLYSLNTMDYFKLKVSFALYKLLRK